MHSADFQMNRSMIINQFEDRGYNFGIAYIFDEIASKAAIQGEGQLSMLMKI